MGLDKRKKILYNNQVDPRDPRAKPNKGMKRMKKTLRIVTLVLAVLLLVGAFAACGKSLKGSYRAAEGYSYVFDGKNFTFMLSENTVLKGTYEIEKRGEDEIILMTVKSQIMDGETKQVEPYIMNGEKGMVLRRGDGYIKIDSTKYFLVE